MSHDIGPNNDVLMGFGDICRVRNHGFEGFIAIAELRDSSLAEVPEEHGVYLVLRQNAAKPHFLVNSPAGWYKGRDPSVSIAELRQNWVADASILYIGKAGSINNRSTLQSRLRAYLQHGAGRKVGHWGGRIIWQLADAESLIIAWRQELLLEPREVERQLIKSFIEEYGRLPFANRTG